jgi:DNA-binding winged helix-turn-helix (wHTH) protein
VISSVRYRFDEFVLSPRQRLLLRNAVPVPLIPKYFDLLLLLVRRRQDAVSKQTIFADVWSDVVVSDGALSQAIRTLRRTLGDNSREPRFIRTVSRYGYQFVWADVVEESDEAPLATVARSLPDAESASTLGLLVDRLMAGVAAGPAGWDDAREAAERLHALGTDEAMAHVARRPHRGGAVAVMRDARWNVPGAGAVPLDVSSAIALIRLRISDAGRTVARRWAGAAAAGALGGVVAGIVGGLALYLSPESSASPQSPLALAAIGALAGGIGAAGVGAGLAAAEVLARARRGLALVVCGGIAGAIVAGIAQIVMRALLDGLFGMRGVFDSGLVEGLVIGSAAGIGYASATRQPAGGGIAAPTGQRRLAVAAIVGLSTASAAAVLALSERVLVGGLVNEIARAFPNAQLGLAPLGHLIGEPDFGPVTRALLSAFEGGTFGCALAWGLTSRRRESRIPH